MPNENIENTNKINIEDGNERKTKKSSSKKIYISLGLFLVLAALGAAYFSGFFSEKGEDSDSSYSENYPSGNLAAEVDGMGIYQSEVDTRRDLILANAQIVPAEADVEQKSQAQSLALQQLINEILILNAAQKIGLAVNPQDVQGELDAVVANFPDQATFEQALSDNNLTLDSLKNDISRRLLIEMYIKEMTDSDNIQITEEEVLELYGQYESQQQDDLPDLEEVRGQLEQQIFQQKLNKQIDDMVAALQATAEIQTF